LDTEEWRIVVIDNEIYEEYEVSRDGEVRSLNFKGHGKIQVLKPWFQNGYKCVRLYKNKKRKTIGVHRLVGFAFIPNPDNLPEINHINEDKTDNRVENLEWSTMKEQNEHGTRTERTRKKVKCIETDITYDSVTQAEQETGVWGTSITRCCRHKCKTAGGFHWKYVN
jgi:hypothetical protein